MQTKTNCLLRGAGPADAVAMASIYNEGISERIATFQSEPQSGADLASLIDRSDTHPVLVAEREGRCRRLGCGEALQRLPPSARLPSACST